MSARIKASIIDNTKPVVYYTGIIYYEVIRLSLPFGLLGLLSYDDSTGYDLTKIFDDSLNNFWHAQSSQIYRELKRLEELGWVSSRNVIQEGRPNKRVYSITYDGRSELMKWLAESRLEFENQHHSMVMRIFFGDYDPKATLALLKKCRSRCASELEAACSQNRQCIETYATIINNGAEKSKYWAMTLDLGMAQTKSMMEWADRCIAQIEEGMAE